MRRLILSLITVLACITFSFFLIHWTPGSPVDLILGENAAAVDQTALKKQMGLDLPLHLQYWNFVKGVFTLNLGASIYNQKPVFNIIQQALPPTFQLALWVLFLAVLWGLPMAVLTAVYKDSFLDRFISVISVGGFSLPVFLSAPLLIWLFSIYWPLLPVSGQEGWSHYILPSLSLAFPLGSALCQMGRASILEIFHQDYIRTAQAKGLSPWRIYLKHALKPSLVPLITILSLQLSALLTGMVIVETIFDWPGIGLLLFRSIARRDYPVIQACVLVMALIYLTVHWLADLFYTWVHPQMRGA